MVGSRQNTLAIRAVKAMHTYIKIPYSVYTCMHVMYTVQYKPYTPHPSSLGEPVWPSGKASGW